MRVPSTYHLSAGANPHMTSSTEATPTPKVAVNDIGSEEAFLAAIDETIKYFNDGDIVWGTIEKIKEEDGVVTGTVIEVVKGGLILDIGLRGFLPASLVEMRRVRDLQ